MSRKSGAISSLIDEARRESGKEPAIRFRVDPFTRFACGPATRAPAPDGIVGWEDLFVGSMAINASDLGDFVIAKADGTPSYQLAVVVDDAAMGVTHVVRGDDLLDSTPRQILLYRPRIARADSAYLHLLTWWLARTAGGMGKTTRRYKAFALSGGSG